MGFWSNGTYFGLLGFLLCLEILGLYSGAQNKASSMTAHLPWERTQNQKCLSLPPSFASWMDDFDSKTLSIPIKSV